MLRKILSFSLLFSFQIHLHGAKFSIPAQAETDPVKTFGDSADDSAFWYNHQDLEKNFIIGTNKKAGLIVYNLKGKVVSEYKNYTYNNVDVKPVFDHKDSRIVQIVAANNKNRGGVDFFTLENGQLKSLNGFIKPKVSSYGLCMINEIKHNRQYVVVTGRKKNADLFRIHLNGDELAHEFVKTFKVSSKNEGCVADDYTGTIFVAEEKGYLWKFDTEAGSQNKQLVDSRRRNSNLKEDIEATLYYKNKKEGYLIASVQGSSEFAVYDRQTLKYIKSFKVGSGKVDEVSGTDGIDVSSYNLGPDYPKGMLVVQDDINTDSGRVNKQNFKLINWEDIKSNLR